MTTSQVADYLAGKRGGDEIEKNMKGRKDMNITPCTNRDCKHFFDIRPLHEIDGFIPHGTRLDVAGYHLAYCTGCIRFTKEDRYDKMTRKEKS